MTKHPSPRMGHELPTTRHILHCEHLVKISKPVSLTGSTGSRTHGKIRRIIDYLVPRFPDFGLGAPRGPTYKEPFLLLLSPWKQSEVVWRHKLSSTGEASWYPSSQPRCLQYVWPAVLSHLDRLKTEGTEWVSGWVSEWVSGWVSEWVSEWASEWVVEWVSEWLGK